MKQISEEISHPFTRATVSRLSVGQRVLVNGLVCTGRDMLHSWLARGKRAPVSLEEGAIYHCGPVMRHKWGRWRVHAAGPTTSMREEPYMASVIEKTGVTVIIGKGGMGPATLAACRRFTCVYLHAIGGAAQVLANTVQRVRAVHFLKEFGPTEAMWELEVAGFPCLVTMDAAGNSLHEDVLRQSDAVYKKLLGL